MAKLMTPEEFLKAEKNGASPSSEKAKGWNTGLTKEVQEDIKKAGTIQDSFKKLGSKSWLEKGAGALDLATAPVSLPISAASNMITSAQAGNFNPITLAKEGLLGLSGQKRGGASDIYRSMGVGKTMSTVAGLGTELLVPAGLARQGLKMLGRGSLLTDKNLARAGQMIVKGSDEALSILGSKLDDAFKGVGNTAVKTDDFIKVMSKLPDNITKALEKELGSDILSSTAMYDNMTVDGLRAIKQTFGKMKAGSWGKSEKGAVENLEAFKLDEAYSGIKKLLEGSIQSQHGKKVAERIMKAEDDFSEASKAAQYLRKVTVDSVTKKPTKAGMTAERYANRADSTTRDSLKTLKRSGKSVEKKLNSAIDSMNAFNAWMTRKKVAEGVGRAFAFGGVAGAVGSSALRRGMPQGE